MPGLKSVTHVSDTSVTYVSGLYTYKGGVVGHARQEKKRFPFVVPMLFLDFDIRISDFCLRLYWTKVQYTAYKRFDRNGQHCSDFVFRNQNRKSEGRAHEDNQFFGDALVECCAVRVR